MFSPAPNGGGGSALRRSGRLSPRRLCRARLVSDVARQADVCPSLIYRWRREIGSSGGFAEVVVAPLVDARSGHRVDDAGDERGCRPAVPAAEGARSDAAGSSALPAIEIEFSGASRVRIPASVPADLAAAVIAALRRR
jgi:transposase